MPILDSLLCLLLLFILLGSCAVLLGGLLVAAIGGSVYLRWQDEARGSARKNAN